MKRIGVLLFCLLAPVVMAQDNSYEYRAIVPDVYEALLVANSRKQDSNMTVDQAKEILEGTIVLVVGYSSCVPCKNMLDKIEEEGFPSLWEREGVRFYQLHSIADKRNKSEAKLIDWIEDVCNQKSVPVLLIIKNGKVTSRCVGYKKDNEDIFVSGLKQRTLP